MKLRNSMFSRYNFNVNQENKNPRIINIEHLYRDASKINRTDTHQFFHRINIGTISNTIEKVSKCIECIDI